LAPPASRTGGYRTWIRWAIPDLALCLAVVTLFYCLILFNAPQKLFRDSDTGWHIVTGEKIVSTMQLPRTDPYSFTRAGQPWVAWEWGADCVIGGVFRVGGLSGLVWIFAIAIAFVTWLWVRLNWAVGGNFFLACLFASPMLSTANLHWLARPHVFSWTFMLGLLWYFESRESDFRFRAVHAVVLTLGTALWANVHASFLFAPLLAMIYAVGHALRPLIWNLDARLEFKRARWFLTAALFTLLGSLLNPYGYKLHQHLIEYLMNGDLLARVGEFQSFNFHVEGSLQILLTMGIAAAGGVLALAEKKLAHSMLCALLLGAALRSARVLPMAAILLLPLANGAITDALRRARDLRADLRRSLSSFLRYSDRLRLLDSGLGGAWVAPMVALLAFFWLRVPMIAGQTGFPRDQFPVIAAGELTTLPPDIRLFAPDKYGGYIIFRYGGARKVFFDGRSDFYGSDFMKQYIRLVEVRPGWQDQLRAFGFTHALLPNDYSLLPALQQLGWSIVFRDDVATLLTNSDLGRRDVN
jgi:hypothetical protein